MPNPALELGQDIGAAMASNRFGLGARPDDPPPPDPAAWLVRQLAGPDPALSAGGTSTAAGLGMVATLYLATPGTPAWMDAVQAIYALFVGDIQALFAGAVATRAPFRERMALFWNNHLALIADRIEVMATAGAYLRDAIRPNVTGSYAGLLTAAITHPAMIYSLDNDESVGPASPLARAWLQGVGQAGRIPLDINENLARETLELYTLGAEGGYTQADVDALAMLLTGLKVRIVGGAPATYYDSSMAQPGSQTLLGGRYPATMAGLQAALAALATHPSTYRHIATKLVAHVTSDSPAAADVSAIAAILARSNGQLGPATAALVGLGSAWVPATKLRAPAELAIASLRAVGATEADIPPMFASLGAMGGLPWRAPFPDGWSDRAADWVGPQQTLLRLAWAQWMAVRTAYRAQRPATDTVIESALGPLLGSASRRALAATDPPERLIVLFGTPEFQRR